MDFKQSASKHISMHLRERSSKATVSTGISTGFKELDDVTVGLHRGELSVIGGRPAMGKTALMLNLIRHMALSKKMVCLLFTLDMRAEGICGNLLAIQSGVDIVQTRLNRLSEADKSALLVAEERLKEAAIYVDDSTLPHACDICAVVRDMATTEKLDICFIDSIRHIRKPPSSDLRSFADGFRETVWMFRTLARELSIPIVVTSTLTGQPDRRRDHRPMISDLFLNSEIEDISDTILLLHRPVYYDADERADLFEIIVAKQRHGPVATAALQFDNKTLRITDMAGNYPTYKVKDEVEP